MTNLSPPPLTSWSPSWSSSQMAQPSLSPANSALRALHGTSGLFDTGRAGNAKLGALPALSSELSSDLPTFNPADLLEAFQTANIASLPEEVDFLQEGNCGEVDLMSSINNIKSESDRMTAEGDDVFYPNEAATGFNEDSFLGTTINSDFLEQFTDLSSYSNDGMTGGQVTFDPEQFMKDMAEIENGETVAPATVKRCASEAFDDLEQTEEPVVNPDHNDYTRKSAPVRPLKRVRTATVTSESDAESVVSSTSSFAVVPMSKDQKYLERRRKNNIASRRSRETRKQKFASMDKQADELEAKNAKLRIKVAELEKLTKLMKDTLVQQLAHAGKAAAAAKS